VPAWLRVKSGSPYKLMWSNRFPISCLSQANHKPGMSNGPGTLKKYQIYIATDVSILAW
jgi:hypothetical protein